MASSSAIRDPWLISFGDLLTLLLGCFITILAQSDLNPAHKTAANGADSASAVPALGTVSDGGIRLALRAREHAVPPKRVFGFTARDFWRNGSELRRYQRTRLKRRAKLEGYHVAGALIESCGVTPGERGWFDSIAQTLAVRRQLFDAGIEAHSVAARVLGPNCGQISRGDLRTRITLEFELNEALQNG
ncbi:MAG: flagellar motor protein MotB [Oligoflexia bacterium]|nr:flagellar motor protein MotB [Oligoflexia bacterium]